MAAATQPPGLIQCYRELLQTRHYARRTVKTYEQWLRRFLRFHGMRHPREMGSTEVNAFLSHLAVNEQVSASTQNQALAALLFLYRNLVEREPELDGVVRARTRQRLPVVLSEAEVRAVRQQLEGEPALVVGLLYGSGLRLMEALRLRVKDLDVERRELTVRDGKGGKDRLTLLPQTLVPALQEHVLQVRSIHRNDQKAGWGRVLMPYALDANTPMPAGNGAGSGCSRNRNAGVIRPIFQQVIEGSAAPSCFRRSFRSSTNAFHSCWCSSKSLTD